MSAISPVGPLAAPGPPVIDGGGIPGRIYTIDMGGDTYVWDPSWEAPYPPPPVNLPGPPFCEVLPVVSGSVAEGGLLTVTNGVWDGYPPPTTFLYQWLRDGAPITGATSQTYTTVPADVTHMISCEVYTSNIHGSLTVSSNAVGPIT